MEDEELGGKGILWRRAIEQVVGLYADTILRKALDRNERKKFDDDADDRVKRCNKAVRPEGER